MADRRAGPGRASVRVRTTAAAVAVVAVALLAGAVALLTLTRASLQAGVEGAAEQQATDVAAGITRSGGPPAPGAADDERDEPDDVVWQVLDAGGSVVSASQPLGEPLPADDDATVRLPGADHDHVVATEDVTVGGRRLTVVAAASLEEVDDSTSALLTPLAVGLPLLLLLVGGTTWMVVTRALAPVERIRREVEEITGDRLDRRVPEPATHDEIHRLARTMNRMLERLAAAQARQQQFVADASHELRSPLASIRQATEVAGSHPGAMPEGQLAETVWEEATRMQRLLEQLLLLTRADNAAVLGARQEVDLDDLALAEAARAGSRRQEGDPVVRTTGVGAGRVRGDSTALAQVVRNLVDNAVRHAEHTVALTVRETGAGVELIVEDDGDGVPPEQRERVFERFVRLDEARARDAGGSGLGLAIVREIVAAHDGTVTIAASEALGGARFLVRLPA